MKWSELTRNQKVVSVLTIITALMHLAFASVWFGEKILLDLDLGFLFIINGIGYIVLILELYFLSKFKDKTDISRIILVLWTLGSIIGWILYHPANTLLDSSLSNKIIEFFLLIFIYLDFRESKL